MDVVIALVIAGVIAAVGTWVVSKVRARRRPHLPEDEGVLPPAPGRAPAPPAPPTLATTGLPVLDRDALVHRDRTFDPTAWDNSPDHLVGTDVDDPDAVASERPQYFDRSFLENRGDATP